MRWLLVTAAENGRPSTRPGRPTRSADGLANPPPTAYHGFHEMAPRLPPRLLLLLLLGGGGPGTPGCSAAQVAEFGETVGQTLGGATVGFLYGGPPGAAFGAGAVLAGGVAGEAAGSALAGGGSLRPAVPGVDPGGPSRTLWAILALGALFLFGGGYGARRALSRNRTREENDDPDLP